MLWGSAAFIAGFSALAATAPWPEFTFEVNPLKVGDTDEEAPSWTEADF